MKLIPSRDKLNVMTSLLCWGHIVAVGLVGGMFALAEEELPLPELDALVSSYEEARTEAQRSLLQLEDLYQARL